MKNKFLVLMFCLFSLLSYTKAQSTTVSVTVVDSTGQAWAGGSITPIFVKRPDFNGPYMWNGLSLPSSYFTPTTIQLDTNGSATFTLPTSNAVLPGSSWSYTVCPNATASCSVVNVPTTGATQDISSIVNASLSTVVVNGVSIPKAYSDNQIKTVPGIGFIYYNVISNALRVFNGTSWNPVTGSGGGATFPNSGIPFATSTTTSRYTTMSDIASLIGVSTSVFPFLDATSSIQTQLNSKLSTLTPSTPIHINSSNITIDQVSLTQPGYLGVNGFSAIPGISPLGYETSGSNGVQALLGNDTYCGSGCSIQVPVAYPFNSFQGYGAFGWMNGFSAAAQKITSPQQGQNKFFCNNPLVMNTYDTPACIDMQALFFGFDGYDHAGIKNNFVDTSPGVNNGYSGTQVNATPGWSARIAARIDALYQGAGIHETLDTTTSCPGGGDCHIYWYLRCYGGFRTPGDEGCQAFATQANQASAYYSGTISAVSGNLVTTTVAGGSYTDLGDQHLAVDISSGSQIASGYATASSIYLGAYTQVTIAGATVTPSKYWGTLDANIDVPTVPLTYLGTLTTFGLTITGGTGTPAAGQYINLSQPYSETIKLVSVTNPSSGHYQITAYVRRNHVAGYTEFESTYGHGAFSYNSNISSSNIPYYYDMIGQTDSTHIILAIYQQGHLVSDITTGNLLGNVSFTQFGPADNLVNVGGVVTVSFYSGYPDNRLYNYGTITIRGSAVAAFNGQCTNVRNFRSTGGGKVGFDCNQSASTGLNSPYPDNSIITFGDTGYGNTRFTIYPAAEVLDVNTYPARPACLSAGVGACNPKVQGQLRLEVNAMPLPIGGTVIVPQDYAMLIDQIDTYAVVDNPMVQGNGINLEDKGDGVNANRAFVKITNSQPITTFSGFGGDHSLPKNFVTRGIFDNGWALDTPPGPGGSLVTVTSCNPGPFTCPTMYPYYWIRTAITGGYADIQINPATNTLAIEAPIVLINGLTAQPIQTVSSAATIAITSNVVTISNTTTINTVNIATSLGTYPNAPNSYVLGVCFDSLATGAWSTSTSGNIYATMTATTGTMYRWCYMGDNKWHVK